MDFFVQIISTHPLVQMQVIRLLGGDPRLSERLISKPIVNLESAPGDGRAKVFILDMCCQVCELSHACRFLRVHFPGSRFLALQPLHKTGNEELLRMLYLGVDGVVRMDESFERLLPEAVSEIMIGNLWYPPSVLEAYVEQTRAFLDAQLHPSHALTPREQQTYQLMLRRLSNKEIASVLGIAERTVKFHSTHIFAKLGVEGRRNLFERLDLERQSSYPIPKLLGTPEEFASSPPRKLQPWLAQQL